MIEIKFEISNEAYNLLYKIKEEGNVEYRDTEYETLEDFRKSDNTSMSVDSYLSRNAGGTFYLIDELLKYNLIDNNYDAWHLTYVLTEFGKEITK